MHNKDKEKNIYPFIFKYVIIVMVRIYEEETNFKKYRKEYKG